MRAALAWARACPAAQDRADPADRLLRDRALPCRGEAAQHGRDGRGVARLPAALSAAAASLLADDDVRAAQSLVRGGAVTGAAPARERAGLATSWFASHDGT